MFSAYYHEKKRQWRIDCDGRDICGAINEVVARETALCLTAYRSVFP